MFLLLAAIFVGTLDGRLPYGTPKPSDVIAARSGYVVGFNDTTHCPDWCYEKVTAANLQGGKVKRTNDFRHDPQVPRSAELEDYRGSGWARGHMVPAADQKWSVQAMSETFLLSNIVPQDEKNNSGAWNRIEQQVRSWAAKEQSLVVITGPIYDKDKPPRYIGATRVRVPDALYKVVLDETPPRKMIAFVTENAPTKAKPASCVVSVDVVEQRTGLDFFSAMPDEEERRLEARSNFREW